MRKIFFTLAAVAFATAIAAVPVSATAKPHDHNGMGSMGAMNNNNHRKCPRGYRWHGAHRGPGGAWIPGQCVAKRH